MISSDDQLADARASFYAELNRWCDISRGVDRTQMPMMLATLGAVALDLRPVMIAGFALSFLLSIIATVSNIMIGRATRRLMRAFELEASGMKF